MNPETVERLLEANIPDASVTVGHPNDPDDPTHFVVRVVSPAFEGHSLVEQHELVYDALGDRVTREIHALEIKTYTPSEYESA
jgi:stress-induced morphogen